MYDVILFDLDGTIIDSAEGILNSFAYAFRKLGLPQLPRSEMRKFIGPPLLYSFEALCELDRAGAERAVEVYREYYREKGMYESRVYEGMEALLQRLCENGKRLVLATSKYELYAAQILENLGLAKYFAFIAGSLADGGRGTKAEIIEYALSAVGADKGSAVMVGDRLHDTEGASAAGIDSVGVLFGYGTKEELCAHGATHIAENAEEIFEIACRN